MTVVAAPPTPVTFAVGAAVAPTATVAVVGVTTTADTAGRGFTVTVADPALDASKVLVAVIVAVPTATPATCPDAETVATAVADELHVTVFAAPLVTLTFAVSCVWSPTTTVTVPGDTETAVTRGVVSGGVDSPPPQAATNTAAPDPSNQREARVQRRRLMETTRNGGDGLTKSGQTGRGAGSLRS